MKHLVNLLLFLACAPVFGQISVAGTGTSLTVANNAPSVVVDPSLTVSSSQSIPGFKVSISGNFSSGDVLAYTGSLPSGVTASYASGSGVLTFSGSATGLNYQTLLRTVTFNTSSTSSLSRIVTFEATNGDAVYNSANGHFYSYVSGAYSWTAANSNANSRNFFGLQGYIATVTSADENTFILSLPGKGWLGGSDEYTTINDAVGYTMFASQNLSEGKWYWVTGPEAGTQFSNVGTVITYASWISGEPNNSSGSEHYVENAWAGGPWNDSHGAGSSGYLLEYGGMAGDPNVDVFHSRSITLAATEVKTNTALAPYTLKAPAVLVDPLLTVYSTGNITNAKVTISGNFKSGDQLTFTGTLPSGVTVSGTGYNSTTGVLSFSGTTSPANWQALFRSVKFSSTSVVTGNRDITFSVGNQVAFSNGHFYESVTAGTNWQTAKANAEAKSYMGLQGYLATITSTAENDFIKQKIGTDAWIGLSDSYTEINAATGTNTYASQAASEGKWYWISGPEKGTQITTANASGSGTGTPYAGRFNNWNSGEPNNYGSGESYGEIYAASAPGKWNDLNGTANLMYVVEFGGLASDPPIYLSANTTILNNSILPVTGLDLNVQVSSNVVNINWSTLTELNCEKFDVLHSSDGVIFKKIGSANGRGDSETKQSYFFVHQNPSFGINYYKIQQFDFDGKYKYSSVKQVNYGNSQTLLSPNPAHARITIFHHGGSSNDNSLIVYNMSGKVMYKTKIAAEKTYVDIQSYPHGLYIAEIKDRFKSTRIMFAKQ